MIEPGGGQSGPTDGLTLLALSDRFSERTRKLVGAYAIGASAYRIGKKWWDKAHEQRTYSIAVLGDDTIYTDVHRWLLDSMPPEKQRAVTAQSSRDRGAVIAEVGAAEPTPELHLFYDGTKTQTVSLGGHDIEVKLERPEWSRTPFTTEERSYDRKMERIVFNAPTVGARDAVYDFLTEIVRSQKKRQPRLYTVTRWSEWTRSADLQPRPLNTVVLRKGQQERLIEDLGQFLSQEADYARLGIPYHRGYLLHGPPGTGKTSIAKAIAGHFGLDVYYLPLTALKDDAVLNSLFAQVDPRSVLLLEDIDIVHGARVATGEEGAGVTLQGLLNTLDGFASPHGLILVMTTNNLDVLDPRLIRPGRVDITEEVGMLDSDQLRRLLAVFIGADTAAKVVGRMAVPLSPAVVVDVLKRHLDDPPRALQELRALKPQAAQ